MHIIACTYIHREQVLAYTHMYIHTYIYYIEQVVGYYTAHMAAGWERVAESGRKRRRQIARA